MAPVAEDLTALQDVNEASILHTLRQRYNKDLIYTSIGPVLIAVNPVRIATPKASREAPGSGTCREGGEGGGRSRRWRLEAIHGGGT